MFSSPSSPLSICRGNEVTVVTGLDDEQFSFAACCVGAIVDATGRTLYGPIYRCDLPLRMLSLKRFNVLSRPRTAALWSRLCEDALLLTNVHVFIPLIASSC